MEKEKNGEHEQSILVSDCRKIILNFVDVKQEVQMQQFTFPRVT